MTTAVEHAASLELAQTAVLRPIEDVAADLGLADDELELYGRYKAKVPLEAIERRRDVMPGKLVAVTAITPTPALLLARAARSRRYGLLASASALARSSVEITPLGRPRLTTIRWAA